MASQGVDAQTDRPLDITHAELGFTPQPAVRWLAPAVLVATGLKALLATIFGAYADKRELQGSLPARIYRHGDEETGEVWFDFVADVGDGFNATYTIASLLARRELEVPSAGTLPRGEMLIMGGDQVYPAASVKAYRDRTKGVYSAALPHADGKRPTLYALPGNHDWYDGLTAFLRVFAQGRPFGGWDTAQTRSYFAIQLPQGWWLYALDTQFDDHIDAPQLEYFTEAAKHLEEGDTVILCTPSPSWVNAHTEHGAEAWDTIEYFDANIVRPAGASIRVMLSGDKHHYSRYVERGGGRQKVTCGLGGAYLTTTDELPKSVVLPPPTTRIRAAGPSTRYDLAARYPDKRQSRRFAAGILRLPFRNPGFWGVAGILQSIIVLAALYGLSGPFGNSPRGFFALVASWTPAVLIGVLVVVGWVAFARLDTRTSALRGTVFGVCHAAVHLGLSLLWAWLITTLYRDVIPDDVLGNWGFLLGIVIGLPVVLGLVHSEVVAVYLMIASRFGINLNELMAGQSIEDHKGFLRMHIDAEGTLRIYPIKVDKVCRRWVADPRGEAGDPLLRPRNFQLRPRLIEDPVVVAKHDQPET
ncbi:metallophosphoesterase family protein [Thermocrispum municipale]|uniref:metallophosphoesterase family protein n=1 Tax=Thermocrispum municipale TaxID=37926 RepID=UPI0003F708FE|nr:metallophosphoesterase [Thermocrispum municipale]